MSNLTSDGAGSNYCHGLGYCRAVVYGKTRKGADASRLPLELPRVRGERPPPEGGRSPTWNQRALIVPLGNTVVIAAF